MSFPPIRLPFGPRSALTVAFAFALLLPIARLHAEEVRDISFPTDISLPIDDNYGVARSGGRTHEAIDIMGDKMTPLYAAVDGTVRSLNIPEASWGYAITLEDEDGYTYHYIHVNNDTPGTDDGDGGTEYAYASTTIRGASVKKGQLIGWMGDSGNAEAVGSHLHFEIRTPNDTPINPFLSLKAAQAVGGFDADVAKAASADINIDKGLVALDVNTPCESGSRIKSVSASAVYYCGANGKRYGFPNERTYLSWYADFKGVRTISDEALAAIPLGGNVTYRPGSRLVKIPTLPNVYAVEKGGVLRWVTSAEIAASIYGAAWAKSVDDISEALFVNYTVGEPITVR